MNPVWRMIRVEIRRHAKAVAAMVLISAVVSSSPYIFSMLGKWLVDEALQVAGPPKVVQQEEGSEPAPHPPVTVEWKAKTTEEKLRLLGIFLAASLGVHVVVTALSGVSELINAKVTNRMTYDLRDVVHRKLVSMDTAEFSREQVGQLMMRVLDDTGVVPGNLTNLVVNMLVQAAMLVLGLGLLFRLNGEMTLIALAALPFYALVCVAFLPRLRRSTEEARVRFGLLNGYLVERLSNVLTIKNYAQEDREVESLVGRIASVQSNARLNQRQNLAFSTLTTLITGAGTLAVLAYGFVNIRAGRMQLGEVLAFYQVTSQLFVPISALVGLATVSQTLGVLGKRIYSVLDAPTLVVDSAHTVQPSEPKGHVSLEGVSLRYQPGGPFAVHDLSFTVAAGQTVCLVGPVGCGKSTVLSLLSRLFDATSGTIRLDGVDIRRMPVAALRQAVVHVLHDCQVFTGTIAENIAYGRPDATIAQVEEIAQLTGLVDFVKAQPAGYRTQLGRGGVTLDGEDLARLGIARALIVRPAVLTIDDTFAALDEPVEEALRAAVRGVLADRTLLIATSRLSICEDADLVVVMQKGGLVQSGTHRDLLAVPGLYRRMYMRQRGIAAVQEQAGGGPPNRAGQA